MSIPSSPIAQKQPKIGTRYIIVSKKGGTMYGWATSWAWTEKEDALRESQHQENADIYALLDPTDAAELERLRQAKYQAELDMRTTAMSRDVPTAVSPRVWNAWITACDRLSAFEKKIGGGT